MLSAIRVVPCNLSYFFPCSTRSVFYLCILGYILALVALTASGWSTLIASLLFFPFYYYYRYSALGPVRAETRAQSGDWYVSGTLHPGHILRGSLPLLSPVFPLFLIFLFLVSKNSWCLFMFSGLSLCSFFLPLGIIRPSVAQRHLPHRTLCEDGSARCPDFTVNVSHPSTSYDSGFHQHGCLHLRLRDVLRGVLM